MTKQKRFPKAHGRKLAALQCHLPFDPPYGDLSGMMRWMEEQKEINEQLAQRRAKIIAAHGSLVEYRMNEGLMEDKDLSHLGHFIECPMCAKLSKSDDGSMFKCTSFKCGHTFNKMD